MIRDLTKSTISFYWALSLLGMRQVLDLFRPGQQQRSSDALGQVTQATVAQLDDSMRGIFRSGDNLQARTVDLAFASLNPINLINPGNWMRSAFSQQSGNGQSGGSQQYGAMYGNGGQGAGGQSYQNGQQGYQNGSQEMGQQPYRGSMRGAGSYQAAQGSATDAALALLNPLNWLNPNMWFGGGRSDGNCGCRQGQRQGMWQAGAGIGQAVGQAGAAMGQAMGQAGAAMGQAIGQSTSMFTPGMQGNGGKPQDASVSNSSPATGWGDAPGNNN